VSGGERTQLKVNVRKNFIYSSVKGSGEEQFAARLHTGEGKAVSGNSGKKAERERPSKQQRKGSLLNL